MKYNKLLLMMLVGSTFVFCQTESIKQWSDLLGKMQQSIRRDMSEQADFDIDLKAVADNIKQLEGQIDGTYDTYKKAELQSESYSLLAESLIGRIIRLEKKLGLADIITGMLKDLTLIMLNKNGGSKIQQKFYTLVGQQETIKIELKKTNEIYKNLMAYFPVSSEGLKSINKYREMNKRKLSTQKNFKKATVRFYERQFTHLENMELQIIENYDPVILEIEILSLEMELETLMLDAALNSIEISGEFINEMLNHGNPHIN